jgi:hypothetical protein
VSDDYSVVAERLRWEFLPEDNLTIHPWYKEYVERRLDPTFRMNTHAERLCAAAYGLQQILSEDEKWLEELERTAREYE